MSKRFIPDTYTILILALALIAVVALWQLQESPEQAYERGKIDGQLLVDSTKPYMTMEIISPSESEIVVQIIEDDTLYFIKEWVDTGYVLAPIYMVRKSWTPYRPDWREDWLDTSKGWYGWGISEAFARSWYYGTDSTDTMPAVERDTLTSRQGLYLLNTE